MSMRALSLATAGFLVAIVLIAGGAVFTMYQINTPTQNGALVKVKPDPTHNNTPNVEEIVDVKISTLPTFKISNPDEDTWVMSDEQQDEGNVHLRNKNTNCTLNTTIEYARAEMEKGWGDGFMSQHAAYIDNQNLTNRTITFIKAEGNATKVGFYTGATTTTTSVGDGETTEGYAWEGYRVFQAKKFKNYDADVFPIARYEYVCPKKEDLTMSDYKKVLDSLTIVVK